MLILLLLFPFVVGDYWQEREDLLKKDENQTLGAHIKLNQLESNVNEILMNLKIKEYDKGFRNPSTFAPSKHFFEGKSLIDKSPIFQIIKQLPKGGCLHLHDKAMVSPDFVFNLTYMENLYACKNENDFKIHFFKEPDKSCEWKTFTEHRKADPNFDEVLQDKFTLLVDDPWKAYPTLNDIWSKFQNILKFVGSFLLYKEVFKFYVYQALQELYEDNVKYVEFRSSLPRLYELNGTRLNSHETAKFYTKIIEDFKEEHPDFIGAKVIFSACRKVDETTVKKYIEKATGLLRDFPNLIAGFDLVGQEDLGKPLKAFVNTLLTISNNTKFFFHAGETLWYGSSTDLNLFDAVLLGTYRIGHGYSIIKHPELMKQVKSKKIGIEVSPISNQVLMMIEDYRNHPANVLIGQGLGVCICSDNPAFWGATGLSYDWYLAFMGMSSRNADLRLLKQLALNSIEHSAMNEEERKEALKLWENDWNIFLNNTLSNCTKI